MSQKWAARRVLGNAMVSCPSAPLRGPQDSLRLCYAKATLPEGTKDQEMYPQFSKGFKVTEDGDVILTRRLCGAGILTCCDLIFA